METQIHLIRIIPGALSPAIRRIILLDGVIYFWCKYLHDYIFTGTKFLHDPVRPAWLMQLISTMDKFQRSYIRPIRTSIFNRRSL